MPVTARPLRIQGRRGISVEQTYLIRGSKLSIFSFADAAEKAIRVAGRTSLNTLQHLIAAGANAASQILVDNHDKFR